MQKKEERKVMVVSGLWLGGWGRMAFIGKSILWIELGDWCWLFAGGRVFVAWLHAHVVGVFKGCGLQRVKKRLDLWRIHWFWQPLELGRRMGEWDKEEGLALLIVDR